MSDFLVTSLTELMPGYNETFTKSHPVIKAVLEASGAEKMKSSRKEYVLTPSGPGTFTKMVTGTEPIQGGRIQDSRRAYAEATEYFYAVDVPLKELRLTEGSELDMAKLLKKYPERAIMHICERIASQLCMGTDADLDGFPTLNGEQSFTPAALANQGLFEFAAATAQTGTVFGHARNSIANWHTQYRASSGFSSDGLRMMGFLWQDCTTQGMADMGGPKIWLSDGVSFQNYLEEVDVPVVLNDKEGDAMVHRDVHRKGVPLHWVSGAMLYNEPAINLSGFSGTAANGVMYAINPDFLEGLAIKGDASMDGKGTEKSFITFRDEGIFPGYDMRRLNFRVSWGWLATQLRPHGVVVGTAIQ